MDGAAAMAETTYTPFQSEPDAAPVRLIVRRVKPTPDSRLAFFANYSYHGFITDRDGGTLELEADLGHVNNSHAEIENATRDLKYGVGLNHPPSGRFAANAAWLAIQVMTRNLARWTAHIGLGEQVVTTKTLRRRFFSIAGRLTLHLPQRWPWENQVSSALARLRALPFQPDRGAGNRPTTGQPNGCPADWRQPSTPVPFPARHLADLAHHRHCELPYFHWRGHRTPSSTPSVGIGPGPFAYAYLSSLLSTPTPHPFGGFGLRLRTILRQAQDERGKVT